MSNFLTEALNKIFGGDKSAKDIKKILPLVDEINEIYATLQNISTDELRAKTPAFQERIKEHIKDIQDEIDGMHKQMEDDPDMDVHEKEELYKRIDELVRALRAPILHLV